MNSVILKKTERGDTTTLVTLAHFSHFRLFLYVSVMFFGGPKNFPTPT